MKILDQNLVFSSGQDLKAIICHSSPVEEKKLTNTDIYFVPTLKIPVYFMLVL